MLRALTAVGLVGVGLGLGVPAEAAKIVFSGQGSVDASQGALVRNAAASNGSPFRFTFTLDTTALTFLEGGDQDVFYDLPVTDFSATIGDYAFTLSEAPGFEPLLSISRGFTFFGQPFSEPVLVTTFNFASARSTGSSIETPFATGVGAFGALAINAFFRAENGQSGLGLDELKDPRNADQLSFSYATLDPKTRQRGTIVGAYSGSYSTSAVPEPATWAMMLLGLGMVGGAVRYRRRTTTTTYA